MISHQSKNWFFLTLLTKLRSSCAYIFNELKVVHFQMWIFKKA